MRRLFRRAERSGSRSRTARPVGVFLAFAAVLLVLPHAAGALEPRTISPPNASASSPRIGSDGAGNVVAVWRELAGGSASIRAATRTPGGDWSPSAPISVRAAATEAPELAVDRLGNAVAVWHRSNGRDSVVQAAVRPAGGQWSAPQDLSPAGELAFNADVAVEAGRATVVWAAMRDFRSVVRSSTRTISGSWSPAETASDRMSNAYAPQVAMDDQGNAVASWQWWDGAYLVIQAAMRPSAGPWAAPETLSGTGRDASRPRLAMDAAGNALVGWLRFDGSWTPGQVASRPAGGTWEPPRNLSERGGRTQGLQLALNRRGDAIVLWIQEGEPWTSYRPAGATQWGSRTTLLSDDFYHYAHYWGSAALEVAVDEEGNTTAVHQRSFWYKQPGRAWEEGSLWDSEEARVRTTVTTDKPRNATALSIGVGKEDDRIETVSYDSETAEEQAKEIEEGTEDEGEDEEFELLKGTAGPDLLIGTPGDDMIYGLGGADRIDGRGGHDVIYGGHGPDRIAGGRGNDVLIGGWDRDVLRGNAGNDRLRGRDGISDTLFGGRGMDQVRLDRWLDRGFSVELLERKR
jgi:RTX calcium-binding nonapeptide repeat (4 copies)